jgi:hypothetical protein
MKNEKRTMNNEQWKRGYLGGIFPFFFLLFSLFICMSACSFGGDVESLRPEDPRKDHPITFNVGNTTEWNNARSSIATNGSNKNYIINVTADFEVVGHTVTFGSVSNVTITIQGAGRTLTLSGEGSLLRIGNNQNVILQGLTLRGHGSNDNSLVYVNGGSFAMNGGEISGNTTSRDGGGVYVEAGTFTMNGGEISGNTSSYRGGGVHMNNGTFTMNGGEISGNITYYDGGGVSVSGGTFTMNGGEISGNTADYDGGGVHVGANGIFRIVTGTIYGNTETDEKLRNTADYSGAAMSGNNTTEFGTFSGSTWSSNGNLVTTDGTIRVVNGVPIGDDGTPIPISNNYTFNVANTIEWDSALSSIATYGSNKNYIINVTAGFDVVGRAGASFGGAEDVTVTIKGVGRTLTLSGEGSLLCIGYSQNVILQDLTLRGHESNNASLVNINGGPFTMEGGKITGNTSTDGGGGVCVHGTFTMNGGKITDNTASSYNGGGGVYVNNYWDDNESFTMNGGEMSGNTADGGGGVYVYRGTFTMNSGKISSNTSTRSSGGVYVGNNGTFTMNSGEISGNTADGGGGVLVSNGTFTMHDGEITGNTSTIDGGGVYVFSGTFMMSGGKITGNTSTIDGGGVYVDFGTFTMNSGEITDNTSTDGGGGVYVSSGTFIMSGGKITGNTAEIGGGVYVRNYWNFNDNESFTMNGGEISGNTSSSYGGGVYAGYNGTFTMNDGKITGNTSSSYGGGVYVGYTGTFTKTEGTITGYDGDTENGNVVKDSSGVVKDYRGHAVYSSYDDKRRETTAGPGVNMDSDLDGAAGGWEE